MKLKAALVGCGRIGSYTRPELRDRLGPHWFPLNHLEAMLAVPELEVVGLCDVSSENLQRASELSGVAHKFNDYKSLIQKVKPDILAVATRTPGRHEIIRFAVDHGVRGLHVEKPMGVQMKNTMELLKYVDGKGVFLSYGTNRRYMSVFRQARQMLQDGAIGELMEIQLQFGKAPLLWAHPHSSDMMLFFNPKSSVRSVNASCVFTSAPRADARTIDEDPVIGFANVVFENGVVGTISSAPGANILLLGTQGQIEILGEGSRILLRKYQTGRFGSVDTEVDIKAGVSGTQLAFSELAGALREKNKLAVSSHEIAEGLRILLMVTLSGLRQGTTIKPQDLDPEFTVTGRTGESYP